MPVKTEWAGRTGHLDLRKSTDRAAPPFSRVRKLTGTTRFGTTHLR
jgi:hypothetical protein